MLQARNLNIIFISILLTSFSSCGLLKKANKTEKNTTEATEDTRLVLNEDEEMEIPEPVLRIPNLVEFKTTAGTFKVKLYTEAPLHKKNFAKLIEKNYYDGLLFHRVIKDFMIQGGDPNSKDAAKTVALGNGGPGYTIPAEFDQRFFHKKGALCAARQGDAQNPQQRSSGSQFYFVTGAVYSLSDLGQMEVRINQQAKAGMMKKYWADQKNAADTKLYAKYKSEFKRDSLNALVAKIKQEQLNDYVPYKFTEEQVKIYTTIGGTPFLDNNYTVFGEVTEGIEVVEKIGRMKTAPGNRPIEDVKIISIKILD